jgi:ubiquitin carboxyl-terminal hydrolase 10
MAHGATADGRTQQDANEFFVGVVKCVEADLRRLNVSTVKGAAKAPAAGQEQQPGKGDKGWLTVGKGKERLTVRQHVDPADAAGAASGPIPGVFGGATRVATKGSQGAGRNVASVVVEPFTTLVVPVAVAASGRPTLLDCIVASMASEAVARADDSGRSMHRAATLAAPLPTVLVVQLQRWAVTREGEVLKLDNVVTIPAKMALPAKLCGGGAAGAEYHLLSVVCHRGQTAHGGHYVTYVAQQQPGQLVLANDGKVTLLPPPTAFDVMAQDTPYMACYMRR